MLQASRKLDVNKQKTQQHKHDQEMGKKGKGTVRTQTTEGKRSKKKQNA